MVAGYCIRNLRECAGGFYPGVGANWSGMGVRYTRAIGRGVGTSGMVYRNINGMCGDVGSDGCCWGTGGWHGKQRTHGSGGNRCSKSGICRIGVRYIHSTLLFGVIWLWF